MLWFVVVIWSVIAFEAKVASGYFRIVGGNNTKIEKHPYQVALILNDKFTCGGSILSFFTVLTAAHCVDNEPRNLFIRAGGTTPYSEGQLIKVRNFCIHPKWNRRTADYDVAVLQLDKPVSFNDRVSLIHLQPEGIAVPDGTEAVAIGWKTNETEEVVENVLQTVALNKISKRHCSNMIYPYRITSRMSCYIKFGEKVGPCNGDSGGPLVVNGKQVGITSWSKSDCGHPAYPTMFTRVEEESISQHIQECAKEFS